MSRQTLIILVIVMTVFVVGNVFYMERKSIQDSIERSALYATPNTLKEFRDRKRKDTLTRHLPVGGGVVVDDNVGGGGADQQPHRVAGLSCNALGGPNDVKAASEMVYWRDIPADAGYTSPFASTGPADKYLTFEPDEGGWNNIRMAMETVVLMAIIMGRTLVMPPQHKMYLLEGGEGDNKPKQKKQFGFEDFFHFDSVSAEHVGLKVMSFEEFLQTVAMTGQLLDPVTGQPNFPPNNRTNWNGVFANYESAKRGHGEVLWKWMRRAATPLDWRPERCVAAFGSEPGPAAAARLDETMHKVRASLDGMANPHRLPVDQKWRVRVVKYHGNPTPVNASTADRLAELLANRNELCVYGEDMQHRKVLHVRGEQVTARLLVHFYAFLFPEDWRHDLWMKRFVRDHLRYKDEIQCAAARVVRAVREIATHNARTAAAAGSGKDPRAGTDEFDGRYDSMHIRRGDFQYKEVKLSAEEIYQNSARVIREYRTVFVATDEKDQSWFAPLGKHYHLLFLSDFNHLLIGINTNYYGMIDQLVASRGDVFFGTYFSTFTGYINRLRGYHSQSERKYGYQQGIIDSYYYAPKSRPNIPRIMRSYRAVEQGFWQQEFPVAWRDIDRDVPTLEEQGEEADNVRTRYI